MIEGQNSLILLLIAFSNVGIEVTVCVCGIGVHSASWYHELKIILRTARWHEGAQIQRVHHYLKTCMNPSLNL